MLGLGGDVVPSLEPFVVRGAGGDTTVLTPSSVRGRVLLGLELRR
jgi:hypothetical protein